jgi:hypothetical protein
MSFRLSSEDAELLQAAKGNIPLRVRWTDFYDDEDDDDSDKMCGTEKFVLHPVILPPNVGTLHSLFRSKHVIDVAISS